jgi:putative ABC transport system ATP-binding protein
MYISERSIHYTPAPPLSQALICLRSVVKEYPTSSGPYPALKGIDLDVSGGDFLGIIGRSGSGKTTLINLISGIDSLTTGSIQVAGTDVHTLPENDLALWRGKNLGVIYQSFQLMPTLSLLDNVLLPMDFCGVYRRRESTRRAMNLLDEVGLHEHIYKRPNEISGGQQQRVAIARALANDPPILLADEPTGRLDTQTAMVIFEIFTDLVKRGKTIVMVTHDRSLARRMTRVLELEDGRFLPPSPPPAAKRQPR